MQGFREIPQSDWLPVTDGKGEVDKPLFSPDGKLIYFMLDPSNTCEIRYPDADHHVLGMGGVR